jgi:hypothetical protein
LDTASRDEIDAVLVKLGKALAKSGMPVPAASWEAAVTPRRPVAEPSV